MLNSQANRRRPIAAGITVPYANFTNPAIQTTRSVAQALRPYPQYGTINTTNSGGDKTGESMYHAGVLKLTQRLSAGFLFQGSYTYSRLMTNADVFSGSTGSMDTAQPELEYSLGRLDQPHTIKLNTVFELPWGAGRRWLNGGVASHVLGGWRIAAVQSYSSGLPIGVTTSAAPLPIFNGSNRPNVTGRGLARADRRRRVRSARRQVSQSRRILGAGRAAGQCAAHQRRRAAAVEHDRKHEYREDDRQCRIKSRLDVRIEAFNLFNRVIWGEPEHELQQRQLRADQLNGQLTAPDAVRVEAVLVGLEREIRSSGG